MHPVHMVTKLSMLEKIWVYMDNLSLKTTELQLYQQEYLLDAEQCGADVLLLHGDLGNEVPQSTLCCRGKRGSSRIVVDHEGVRH